MSIYLYVLLVLIPGGQEVTWDFYRDRQDCEIALLEVPKRIPQATGRCVYGQWTQLDEPKAGEVSGEPMP